MANKVRIQKLIDALQKYSKWNQSSTTHCAVKCGKALVTKTKNERWCYNMGEDPRFEKYFGVDRQLANDIFGADEEDALDLLRTQL